MKANKNKKRKAVKKVKAPVKPKRIVSRLKDVHVSISGDNLFLSKNLNELIRTLLVKNGKIKINSLGTFAIRAVKEKKMRYHFGGGKIITTPAHNRVHFTPIATFNQAVN